MICMRENKKNKGFSGLEFLIISCLCGIFACIVLAIAFSTANHEKIKTMRYKAQLFKNNAEAYTMITHIENDTVFLWDLIDKEISKDITSPFSKGNNCDISNSYVTFEDEQTLVTLQCDDYIIYQTDLKENPITIYSVSSWKEEVPNTKEIVDKEILYNYVKNGKEMLEEPVTELLFLKQFNAGENTDYESIYAIKEDNIRVYGKTYYRTRKAILEVSN